MSDTDLRPATMRQLGLTVGLNFDEFLNRQANFLAVRSPLTCKYLFGAWHCILELACFPAHGKSLGERGGGGVRGRIWRRFQEFLLKRAPPKRIPQCFLCA
jgi:hypothetical protein